MSAANQLVMVLFLTYFMLLSDQLFKRKLVEMVGSLSQKKTTVSVLEETAGQIEQFMVIQILTSGAVAVVTWGVLWAMGLQQAALWGLLAGVFNSFPTTDPAGDGRTLGRRVPAVWDDRHGGGGCGRVTAHHDARTLPAHPDVGRPCVIHEAGGGVRGAALLRLDMGHLGLAPRRADDDGHQSHLRSR
jgi:hypothetical protein